MAPRIIASLTVFELAIDVEDHEDRYEYYAGDDENDDEHLIYRLSGFVEIWQNVNIKIKFNNLINRIQIYFNVPRHWKCEVILQPLMKTSIFIYLFIYMTKYSLL